MKKHKIIFINAVTLVALGVSIQSQAVELVRRQLPVIAGTEIYNIRIGSECTAGLIVKKTGIRNNLTEYQRAVRYIVTAGHCDTAVGYGFLAGGIEGTGGEVIGNMIWISDKTDLGLIRVEPSATRYQNCFTSSLGPHCVIAVRYSPRAVGKVFMTPQRVLSDNSVPIAVSGTGFPASGQTFCTSGSATGVNCNWTNAARAPGWQQSASTIQGATNRISSTQRGDSGGPVVSRDGIIYGILSFREVPLDPSLPFYVAYTPVSTFFNEQPGYELAPQ